MFEQGYVGGNEMWFMVFLCFKLVVIFFSVITYLNGIAEHVLCGFLGPVWMLF